MQKVAHMLDHSSPLLRLENVCKRYHQNLVLENISFSVNRGETVTLIGPNGAGKSTLMKISLGILGASSGEVHRSQSISVGYMPQKVMIDDVLPLSVHEFLYLRPNTSHNDVTSALETVSLTHLTKQPIQSVSGGEMQRVLLARALLGKPDLLVLDEPVQGIDIMGQKEIYGLIAKVRDDTNCGVLMISHDLHLVMASTDQVLCLDKHICCRGSPELIKNDPEYHAMMGRPMEEIAFYKHHHDHTHDAEGRVIPIDPAHDHSKGNSND